MPGSVSLISLSVLTGAQLPDLEGIDFDDVDERAVVGDCDVVRHLETLVGDVERVLNVAGVDVDNVALSLLAGHERKVFRAADCVEVA